MPVVPAASSIRLSPARPVFQSAAGATPEAFGAASARQLSQGGQQLSQAAEGVSDMVLDMQRIDNEREVKDAQIAYKKVERLRLWGDGTPQNVGFLGSQQDDTIGQYQGFIAGLEEDRLQIEQAMSNDLVKAEFKGWSEAQREEQYVVGSKHLIKQRNLSMISSNQGLIEAAIQSIAAAPYGEQNQSLIGDIRHFVEEILDLQGETNPLVRDNAVLQATSAAHQGAINNLVQDNPLGAMAYFMQNIRQIDPTQWDEIRAKLRAASIDKIAQDGLKEAEAFSPDPATQRTWIVGKMEGPEQVRALLFWRQKHADAAALQSRENQELALAVAGRAQKVANVAWEMTGGDVAMTMAIIRESNLPPAVIGAAMQIARTRASDEQAVISSQLRDDALGRPTRARNLAQQFIDRDTSGKSEQIALQHLQEAAAKNKDPVKALDFEAARVLIRQHYAALARGVTGENLAFDRAVVDDAQHVVSQGQRVVGQDDIVGLLNYVTRNSKGRVREAALAQVDADARRRDAQIAREKRAFDASLAQEAQAKLGEAVWENITGSERDMIDWARKNIKNGELQAATIGLIRDFHQDVDRSITRAELAKTHQMNQTKRQLYQSTGDALQAIASGTSWEDHARRNPVEARRITHGGNLEMVRTAEDTATQEKTWSRTGDPAIVHEVRAMFTREQAALNFGYYTQGQLTREEGDEVSRMISAAQHAMRAEGKDAALFTLGHSMLEDFAPVDLEYKGTEATNQDRQIFNTARTEMDLRISQRILADDPPSRQELADWAFELVTNFIVNPRGMGNQFEIFGANLSLLNHTQKNLLRAKSVDHIPGPWVTRFLRDMITYGMTNTRISDNEDLLENLAGAWATYVRDGDRTRYLSLLSEASPVVREKVIEDQLRLEEREVNR